MWNFTALDTSTTTNRRSYFRSGVTLEASSTAKETFYPVIRAPSNFSPPPHAPRHTPRHAPTPPPRTPHRRAHPTATRPRHTHSLSCSCAPLMHITPSPKSHVIPPGPHSSTAQKPRSINDLISNPETSSGELRAKLLRLRSQGPTDHTPPGGRRIACGVAAALVGGGARAGLEIDHSER